MADFSQYGGLSEEFRKAHAALPPPKPPTNLAELISTTNAGRERVSAEAFAPYAPLLHVNQYSIPTRDGSNMQARSYRSREYQSSKPLTLYIHLHGGGFLFGTLDSEDAICARIATSKPVVVLNINYRHTPEFVYPTAWNDTEDAYEWAYENATLMSVDPESIVVGGISGGATLTAALAQTKLRTKTPSSASLKGQILMTPNTVHIECYASLRKKLKSDAISSYIENASMPVLPRAVVDRFNSLVHPTLPAMDDRKANPGNTPTEELKGLAPAVISVAGADVLRDEGLLYAQSLVESGYVLGTSRLQL